jgi:hypothetical protein
MKTYEELTNAIMNGTAADGSIGVEEETAEAATVMVNAEAPVIAMPSASNYSDTTTTTAANAKQPSSTTATTTTTTATTNNNNNKNLCRFFFQNMQCRYGSKCRFSHEIPQEDMTREEILKTIPCPHYTRGDCFLGDACELLHPQQEEQEEEEKEDIIWNLSRKCVQHPQKTIWITLVLQSHLLFHMSNGMAFFLLSVIILLCKSIIVAIFRGGNIFFLTTCLSNMS